MGEVLPVGLGRGLGADLQPAVEGGQMVVVFSGVQDGLVKGGGEQAGHRLGGLRRGEVFVQDLFVVDVGQLERELPGLEERAHLDLFVGGGAALFALGQCGKDEAVIKKRLDACEHGVTLLMMKIWIPFQYSTFRPLCRAVKKL